MKKIFLGLVLLLIIGGGIIVWLFLGAATGFSSSKEVLYIRTHAATRQAVLDSLHKNKIITNTSTFNWLARQLDLWKRLKPGKYDIKKGSSVLSIVRMLRNGRQTPVNLVITKLRTKEDLARLTGNKFEFDSLQMIAFLNNNDSLQKFDVDSATAMSIILPDTYTYFWNTTPSLVFKKWNDESKKYWTGSRKQKAQQHGLTPTQVYILASIIEEETTNNAEKGTIASVYLNRMKIGMPLQADPTVKFALKDFGLKRIYEKHTQVESAYNTYRNKGLPPGPICTPSKKTIEAVLNAPQTSYLYFVARPDVRETHDFSETYEEHLKKARSYHLELNRRDSANQAQTK
ncbi:MAG TPA: endolytic transglycosylase MltG [Flavisolibacter sp.]|nr:endolytic transglycosylase MltG [Flavisolibacter sp.]